MEHSVIGVYDSYAQAQNAMGELLAAGFAQSDVQLNPDQDQGQGNSANSDDAQQGSTFGAFFRNLFGLEDNDHHHVYSEAVRRGSCILTVHTRSDADRDRAVEIMDRFDAVDIDERVSEWRSQGWTGYNYWTATDSSVADMRKDDDMGQASGRAVRHDMDDTDDMAQERSRSAQDGDTSMYAQGRENTMGLPGDERGILSDGREAPMLAGDQDHNPVGMGDTGGTLGAAGNDMMPPEPPEHRATLSDNRDQMHGLDSIASSQMPSNQGGSADMGARRGGAKVFPRSWEVPSNAAPGSAVTRALDSGDLTGGAMGSNTGEPSTMGSNVSASSGAPASAGPMGGAMERNDNNDNTAGSMATASDNTGRLDAGDLTSGNMADSGRDVAVTGRDMDRDRAGGMSGVSGMSGMSGASSASDSSMSSMGSTSGMTGMTGMGSGMAAGAGSAASASDMDAKEQSMHRDWGHDHVQSHDHTASDGDDDYRTHWQRAYGSSGGRYEDYDAAYRYGSTMGRHEQYRNYRWDDVEPQLRSDWESNHPESTWERVKDAVRYGAERVMGDEKRGRH